ncbi:EEF1A lysine methyltransferase 1 [Lamellibrachia satsuma]|nr:EEF1A lysine methyltransferase 1 [Lamellibrachia satsuma]
MARVRGAMPRHQGAGRKDLQSDVFCSHADFVVMEMGEDSVSLGTELSADTLQALLEFDRKQGAVHLGQVSDLLLQQEEEEVAQEMPVEDWELSQFWYTEETAKVLATEAVSMASRIACVSCPSLYLALLRIKPDTCDVVLFEYDSRFDKFGQDFVFYDYNNPHQVDPAFHQNFDLVVADPPFLSEECLGKVSETVKLLAKDKIILCTGAVMEEEAKRLLGLTKCKFVPVHSNNLANEFLCYTNYSSTLLN